MRFTIAAALAGAALFAAGPALAQDMSNDGTGERAPFTGLYVGAAGGYDVQSNDDGSRVFFDRGLTGNFNSTITTAAGVNAFGGAVGGFCNGRATGATGPGNAAASARCINDKDGAAYYGRVGFDSQMGHLVFGVVGEFGKSEINDSVSAFSTTPASYTLYREIDYEGSVRGRVGFAFGDGLFYATGGPAYARIDHNFFTTNTANAFAQRGRRMQLGITGGGGVEKKLGEHFSIGLEYMYHRYDDNDFRVRVKQGTQPATNPFILNGAAGTDFRRGDTSFQWHSVRGTAAFRF